MNLGEPSLRQQAGKETLRQVLCIMRPVTLATNERVEWIPVEFAEACESRMSLRGAVLEVGGDALCANDHAPVGGVKLVRFGGRRTGAWHGPTLPLRKRHEPEHITMN